MKILITGGAGFIGSNLTKYHLSKNDDVCIVDNLITGSIANIAEFSRNSNFHFYEKDVTAIDYAKLKTSFNLIYNLASPASPCRYKQNPVETLMTNSLGTYKLLEYVRQNYKKATIVQASTSEVYGDPHINPQTEDYFGNVNPIGLRSCYDEGKRFAEALCITYFRKYNLDVRIARIFNTYGPNMEKNDGRVVSNFIMQGLTGVPLTIYGNGNQTRSFCYVSDMIEGLYLLGVSKNLAGSVINLGNPDEKKIIVLANLIIKLVQAKSSLVFKEIDEDDPKQRKPDISKAKKLLKWQPKIQLQEGLKTTISYFQKRFI